MVAREAGITPQGLRRYFRNIEDLREVSLKYIRILGQQMALDRISQIRDPVKLFCEYVRVHFIWTKVYKTHARVWLSFLSSCPRQKKDRQLNQLAVEAGHDRIVELIHAGVQACVFNCAQPRVAAHLVRTVITGWTLCLLTEELKNETQMTEAIIEQCLRIVGHF